MFYPSVSLIFFKFRHLKVTATNLGWIMPDGFVIILEQTDKCFKYLEKHQTSLQRVLLSKLLLGTFFLSPVVITWVNEERMNSGIRLFKLTERIIRVFEYEKRICLLYEASSKQLMICCCSFNDLTTFWNKYERTLITWGKFHKEIS